MAQHKLSKDDEAAIFDVLSKFDLTLNTQRDFLRECARLVSVFRTRYHKDRFQHLLTWCDRSAEVIRQLRIQLARCPSQVRLALRKDVTVVSKRLPRIERQFRSFAKATRDHIPKNRPPETIKDDLAEQVGSWLICARIPVVSTPEGAFVVLCEILWSEISGSDDVNLYQHTYRALSRLKKNHPQHFAKKRHS